MARSVHVTFVDAETSAPFAHSSMPLEQLPDTFGIHTEVTIGDETWVITEAEPVTKAEFSRTGQVVLTVRKAKAVDPSRLLYSLPSICGAALPDTAAEPRQGDVYVMDEDDWRQCELVGIQHATLVSRELAAIRRVHEQAGTSAGWREIHVRELIERPLPEGIPWSKVAALLGPAEAIGGVAFGDASRPAAHAPAVRFPDGVVVWGVESQSGLVTVCVENVDDATADTARVLAHLCDELSLACVYWCACRAYMPGGARLSGAVGTPWEPRGTT